MQGPMADWDLFQNHLTESEDQDLCGNLSKCALDPDMDSIDRGHDFEGFMDMDGSAFRAPHLCYSY